MRDRRLLLLVLAPFVLLAIWTVRWGAAPPSAGRSLTGSPAGTASPGGDAVDRRIPAEVAAALPGTLDAWRGLYGEQGLLSPEETLVLKARRRTAEEALQADIGASGPEGARWAVAAIPAATGSRERLVLLGGLARNPSPEAVAGLQAVYAGEPSLRMREEALRALGQSEGEGATEALVATVEGEADERLRQIAVQSLAGDPAAIPALQALARDPSQPVAVRLEAIPSLGAVGSPEARAALAALAQDPSVEARIRRYAQRALARSGA